MIYLKMPDGREYEIENQSGELVVPRYGGYIKNEPLTWFINRWSYFSRVRGGSNEEEED